MAGPDSIHINSALRIKKLLIEGRFNPFGVLAVKCGVVGLVEGGGNLFHQHQRPVMEGVDDRVDVGEDKSVGFPLWPVHDVPQLPVLVVD